MGSSSSPSCLLIGVFLFLSVVVSAFPSVVQAGITRHYKFDVCSSCLYSCVHLHVLQLSLLFAGTNGKRDQTLQHEEHRDGQRAVPGAEDSGQRRRPGRRQGDQPCPLQRHHSLVWYSLSCQLESKWTSSWNVPVHNHYLFWAQAWRPAAAERMGWRAGLRDSVPYPDGAQLRLQLHHCGAKGDSLLARPHFVAQGDPLWPHHHPPRAWCSLPFHQTLQRSPCYLRYQQSIVYSITDQDQLRSVINLVTRFARRGVVEGWYRGYHPPGASDWRRP